MPLLATLLSGFGSAIYGLFAAILASRVAVRMSAVLALAAIYISCVVYFSTMIEPWLSGVFATQYGQLLGLLFPPVAGSVMASLAAYWTCVIGLKYTSSLTKMAVG